MKKRLESLDILRGLTVFLMIMVNNGIGDYQYSQMNHSQWHGFTLCDLVFPSFLFIVGVSAYLALSKTHFAPTHENVVRILLRTLKLFLVGVALHAWDTCMWNPSILLTPSALLADLRIWGVLQRIALSYGIVSLILLAVNKAKWLLTLAISLFAVYTLILFLGNGFEESETNILCIVDRTLFGEAHLYHKSPIDPEGLLGVIPSIGHVLIGATVGVFAKSKSPMDIRLRNILCLGVIILIAGILLNQWVPLNKRLWTPSYALLTCGIGSVLLVLLNAPFLTRILKPFGNVGRHAFAVYILSEMLCSVMYIVGINTAIYNFAMRFCSPELSSLIYSILFATALCLPFAFGKKKQ